MIQNKAPAIPECPTCKLPLPICACSLSDTTVYRAIQTLRNDIKSSIYRERSPEEGISDYEKSQSFIEAYMLGRHSGNLRTQLKGVSWHNY